MDSLFVGSSPNFKPAPQLQPEGAKENTFPGKEAVYGAGEESGQWNHGSQQCMNMQAHMPVLLRCQTALASGANPSTLKIRPSLGTGDPSTVCIRMDLDKFLSHRENGFCSRQARLSKPQLDAATSSQRGSACSQLNLGTAPSEFV